MDDFCHQQPIDRLRRSVVIPVACAADRGFNTNFSQAYTGVPDPDVPPLGIDI
jgi:hypothetical protein